MTPAGSPPRTTGRIFGKLGPAGTPQDDRHVLAALAFLRA